MAKTTKQETSAEIVSSVDDLLLQILLVLPIRSLIRFKSVSKHWLSLISSPAFAILHRRDPKPPPLGLFLRNRCLSRNPEFEFVNFDIHNPIRPPFSMVESSKGPLVEAVNIVQSCNGLFLCSVTQVRCEWRKYHLVFNPTTKQSTAIPRPSKRTIQGISLAFDPAKSPPAYKVICILDSDSVLGSFEIKIYSPETRSWRVSGKPFKANHDFKNGVYWNGAIHWLCHWRYDKFMYFNVDDERLAEMPNLYPSECDGGLTTYFGESNGHLHLIELDGMTDYEFEINEMESDYSRWFVKFRVRLSGLSRAFPKMVLYGCYSYCLLSVLAVIRGEEEEDAFVVLQILGKAIRYNLADDTFHKLCDFVEEDKVRLRFHDFCAHQFFESLVVCV